MGPLSGIKVLDMSRILAGPWAGQVFADMGADVIKVERPGSGDDTRAWGPPFLLLEGSSDQDHGEFGGDRNNSGYYSAANRGKKSLTLDFRKPEGQAIIKKLLADTDILIENYKYGDLAKYGLDYDTLKSEFPRLIYASITGFGQTGPYKTKPGYDYIIQGMAGLMSVTGCEQSGPMRVGIATSDLFTGLYTSIAVLGALHHRSQTGEGQAIDMALMDTAVAVMANQAQNYLISGEVPGLVGNTHPNLCPYQVFEVRDGHIIVAVGNDAQYVRLCKLLGRVEWAEDARYLTMALRVKNRDILIPPMVELFKLKTRSDWLSCLDEASIPAGPINGMDDVFKDPQVIARDIQQKTETNGFGAVPAIRSPILYSKTKQEISLAPPMLGEHTKEILSDLGYEPSAIKALKQGKIV